MRRGAISAGDLVNAIVQLDANDAAAAQVASLLGLVLPARPEPLPPIAPPIGPQEQRPREEIASLSDAEASTFLASRLERVGDGTAVRAHVVFRSTAPLPPQTSEADEQPPPFEPLLRQVTSRAIVSHALSTRRVTGLDIDRIVERIAQRDRLEPLPLRAVSTMRQGVQLLVDVSTGMTLFRGDQKDLTDRIMRVAGHDRVTVASFIGTPRIRCFGGGMRGRYAPPAPNTPVVLLTDLGIARPRGLDNAATSGDWLAFAEQLRRAHCPAIAFVPYRSTRWPLSLRRAFTILEWDRALTASRARRR